MKPSEMMTQRIGNTVYFYTKFDKSGQSYESMIGQRELSTNGSKVDGTWQGPFRCFLASLYIQE